MLSYPFGVVGHVGVNSRDARSGTAESIGHNSGQLSLNNDGATRVPLARVPSAFISAGADEALTDGRQSVTFVNLSVT